MSTQDIVAIVFISMHRNLYQHIDFRFGCEPLNGSASNMVDGNELRAKRPCDLLSGVKIDRRPATVVR